MILRSENRILNALVRVTTVVVVICYAWLSAHLMEPQYSLPSSVISGSFFRTPDAKLHLLADQHRFHPRESVRANRELTELEPLLNWLGPIKRPLELVIDEKDQDRLSVTDTRIEIGTQVLLARGQLTKAVLKAWILQSASVAITSSHLRTEIASDVLFAMLKGDFVLEVPGFKRSLQFDKGETAWWRYADSYQGVCVSPWKSLELASLCRKAPKDQDSESVSTLSFRGFIGSRIWKSYQSTPVVERLVFVRRWVESLALDRDIEVHTVREGWLTVVLNELDLILPAAMDPLASQRGFWSHRIDAPLVVIDSAGKLTAPGTLKVAPLVASKGLEISHARMTVLTSCTAPTLKEVLNLNFQTERVVWRPECAERKTDFVQVRPSAIRLALARRLALSSDKVDEFVTKNRDVPLSGSRAQMLGLADAKWDEQSNAFRVRGAIEAVESFRLKKN